MKLAYLGDGNNVCNSLSLGAALTGMDFMAATPLEYAPDSAIISKAASIAKKNGCSVETTDDPQRAAQGADVIYTDTWVSMGQETEALRKQQTLKPYQINRELMALAKKDCLFMHCLPAHRGLEVTDEVIDGPHSVVFDQAENRLHAQKAILIKLMGGAGRLTIRSMEARNSSSRPSGTVAPAAMLCPPPEPPTASDAVRMADERSRPWRVMSRVPRPDTFTVQVPSRAFAKAMIGRSAGTSREPRSMPATMPTMVSSMRSPPWK